MFSENNNQITDSIREFAQFLGDIVDAVDQAIIATDLQGRIVFWNRFAEELYGWSEQEVLGRNVVDVTPSPEAREMGAELIQALARGETWSGEFMVQRRDGSRFPAFVTDSPIYSSGGELIGVVGISYDISARKKREEERARLIDELEEASSRAETERTRLYALLMNAPAYICVLRGPDHEFEMANHMYREMVGGRELLGRTVREVFPESESQRYVDLLDDVYRTGRPFIGSEQPVKITREDGATRTYVVNFVYQPITEEEKVTGVFAHGVDVTAQVEARRRADELLEQFRDLNEALARRVEERTEELTRTNQQLLLRNRELQEFAFAASHDLKEPLRKVTTFIDLFLQDYDDSLDPPGRDLLERARRGAFRMNDLIKSLLTYSRVATHREGRRVVELNETLDEVLADLSVILQETDAVVSVGPLPAIEADAVQMRQLFQNLIANAVKFRRQDAPPEIEIRPVSADDPDMLCLEVRDNGIGFDETHADKIFAPFQRLHGRGSRYDGTGMGLAICRRIVERHGGHISARSRPGAGSTFTIELPRHSAGGDVNGSAAPNG